MPEVLLTGGTGFIGQALLDRLLAEGRTVRALVRSATDAEAMRTRGVDPANGDLTDEESLRRAARGCAVVFHVAGLNAMCLRHPSALERANVEGTRAVVRAAAHAGVERVVYTSSAAVIGEPVGTIGTETTTHRGSYLTSYERSKHLAEVAAFEEAAATDVDLVAVNPSSVQGPGRTDGTARILIAYLRGRLRFAVDTRLSLVFIGDVVDAHLAAERFGRPGQRYLVSGWTTTVAAAMAMLGSAVGVEHRVRYLPEWVLGGAAGAVGGWYRLLGRNAPLCPEMARVLRHGHAYDGSLIVNEWGFAYTPPPEWLAQTVEWYREHNLI